MGAESTGSAPVVRSAGRDVCRRVVGCTACGVACGRVVAIAQIRDVHSGVVAAAVSGIGCRMPAATTVGGVSWSRPIATTVSGVSGHRPAVPTVNSVKSANEICHGPAATTVGGAVYYRPVATTVRCLSECGLGSVACIRFAPVM